MQQTDLIKRLDVSNEVQETSEKPPAVDENANPLTGQPFIAANRAPAQSDKTIAQLSTGKVQLHKDNRFDVKILLPLLLLAAIGVYLFGVIKSPAKPAVAYQPNPSPPADTTKAAMAVQLTKSAYVVLQPTIFPRITDVDTLTPSPLPVLPTVTRRPNVLAVLTKYWPPAKYLKTLKTKSGALVSTIENRGAVCPMTFPLGTDVFLLDGRAFTCLDSYPKTCTGMTCPFVVFSRDYETGVFQGWVNAPEQVWPSK